MRLYPEPKAQHDEHANARKYQTCVDTFLRNKARKDVHDHALDRLLEPQIDAEESCEDGERRCQLGELGTSHRKQAPTLRKQSTEFG